MNREEEESFRDLESMAEEWWNFDSDLIETGDVNELARVRLALGVQHKVVTRFKDLARELDWGISDGENARELRFATYLNSVKGSTKPTKIPSPDDVPEKLGRRKPAASLLLTPLHRQRSF